MKKILSASKARSIIKGFRNARLLVIGDLIMDHFIWGSVTRISPEAPVPVVDVTEETLLLGGGANVVNNVASLGGKSFIAGVAGRDSDGKRLLSMLIDKVVTTDGIIIDKKRPTTTKTRVIAHNQQVVRFDREEKNPIGVRTIVKVMEYIKSVIKDSDAVVISDYAKGLVTKELVWCVMELAKELDKPVVVDPKVEHFDCYSGATIVTPNNNEASLASGVLINDKDSLKKAGKSLLKNHGIKAVLITRGEHGMSLFEKGSESHIPTVAREVYDVSGAGDTVVGAVALSLAAGASVKEAAVLSNLAAGIVVGKLGTATVTPKELLEAVGQRLK